MAGCADVLLGVWTAVALAVVTYEWSGTGSDTPPSLGAAPFSNPEASSPSRLRGRAAASMAGGEKGPETIYFVSKKEQPNLRLNDLKGVSTRLFPKSDALVYLIHDWHDNISKTGQKECTSPKVPLTAAIRHQLHMPRDRSPPKIHTLTSTSTTRCSVHT